MCGLFGFSFYGKNTPPQGLDILLAALAKASSVRGTDATGIAYNLDKKLEIDKAPKDAYSFQYSFPKSRVIMGHTRKTTQGEHKKNYNNHPFRGKCGQTMFALAHNGMLSNDEELKAEYDLPTTQIETDSYVAVQMLERFSELSLTTIKLMAETVEGMFTFSLLDAKDNLYFVKNNNPLAIAHIPDLSLYVYASTIEILLNAMLKATLTEQIIAKTFTEGKLGMTITTPKIGTILRISPEGNTTEMSFTPTESYSLGYSTKSSFLYGDDEYYWNDYSQYTRYSKKLSSSKTSAFNISPKTGAISDLFMFPKKGGK